jgi:hypothetical protein
MKKRTFLAIIIIAGLSLSIFSSCNKVKDIVKFNIPVTMEYDFVIPPIPDTTQSVSAVVDINYNVDSVVKSTNEQLGVGNVRTVNISSVILTIPPESQDAQDNFTALSALSLAISSDQNQNWVTLCSITAPPVTPYTLDMPVNKEADLSSYFTSDKFHFKIGGKAHRITSKIIKGKATIKFIIVATL